ncbi:MAG: protein translocase subunit SecD [Gemmatimonadota bacterium]
MLTSLRGRFVVIAGLIALCGWTLLPKEGPEGGEVSPLNLGLDLQGGMHLAVEIDDPDNSLTEEETAQAIETALTTIRNRINEFGVREPTIQKVGDERIIVELAGIENPERAKEIVEQNAFLEFKILQDGDDFRRSLERIDRAIVSALGAENIRSDALEDEDTEGEEEGLQDILSEPEGDTADAPADDDGAQDPGEGEDDGPDDGQAEEGGDTAGEDADGDLRPLSSLLLESGTGGILLVPEQDEPTARRYLELQEVQDALPRDTEVRWSANTVSQGGTSYRQLYVLESEPMITGEYLADAGPAQRDPTYNRPVVPFEMNRRGARLFERATSQHVGEQMAIVLDGRVQSAPVIRQALSRRAQIELSQGDSFEEAQDLALVLRAGALPQPIRIVEERTVGPSLGEDSIRQGQIAFAIGIALVVVLMIAYYRLAGAMAVAALGVYVLLLLGGLAGLNATLTLPGIAGIILSIGMAVDANVLIFERIREEIDAGKRPRTAVEGGFDHALSAIVDANLTTLITALILFQFGTGPVKGFAVTLSIGIIASFFSALYVTRTFFMVYLERHAPGEPVSI